MDIYKKFAANVVHNSERKCFSSKTRKKVKMPTLATLIQQVLGVLVIILSKVKHIKDKQMRKEEIKLSLYGDDMMLT